MKKFLSLFLVALVMFGCVDKKVTDNTTPQEKYNKTIQALNNLDSYEMDLTMDISLDEADYDTEIGINMKVEDAKNEQGPNSMITMSADEQSVTYFIKDGYVYMDMLGMKIKMPATSDDTNFSENMGLEELSEGMIERLESFTTKDGFKLMVKCNKDELEALSWTEEVRSQFSEYELELKGSLLSFEVTSDYNIKQIILSYDMELKEAGSSETFDANFTITLDYKGHNATKIEYPTDLDSYMLTE